MICITSKIFLGLFQEFWNNYIDVCPVFEDLSTLLRIFVYQFICFGRINIHVSFLSFWICMWREGGLKIKSHFVSNFSIKKHDCLLRNACSYKNCKILYSCQKSGIEVWGAGLQQKSVVNFAICKICEFHISGYISGHIYNLKSQVFWLTEELNVILGFWTIHCSHRQVLQIWNGQ